MNLDLGLDRDERLDRWLNEVLAAAPDPTPAQLALARRIFDNDLPDVNRAPGAA